MELRERTNTGIQTPQQRNLDYFVLSAIGANLLTGTAYCEIMFYEFAEAYVNGYPANAHRRLEWEILEESSIEAGVSKVYDFESVETTAGDLISLSNSTIV